LHIRNAKPEESALLQEVDPARMPAHLAIIMDGNRRWAREHSLPSIMGHRAGVRAFREVVRTCTDLGVQVVTAYAFSLENWKRSQQEVGILMHLFEHYSKKDRADMLANGIRFRIIGDSDELPQRVRNEFEKTMDATRDNNKMILNLAVNYGSRGELVRAIQGIAADAAQGRLDPRAISEEDVSARLFTAGQPEPDLLIRTSGEVRISNFLLWQMAYTEFWFTPRYWPDFSRLDLLQAIVDYQRRDRRYGGGSQDSSAGASQERAAAGTR
jgi:undecaprenyl diphosphate synthase